MNIIVSETPELYAGKLARTVLWGPGGSNAPWLPDIYIDMNITKNSIYQIDLSFVDGTYKSAKGWVSWLQSIQLKFV